MARQLRGGGVKGRTIDLFSLNPIGISSKGGLMAWPLVEELFFGLY